MAQAYPARPWHRKAADPATFAGAVWAVVCGPGPAVLNHFTGQERGRMRTIIAM